MISTFLFSILPAIIDRGFGNLNGSLEQVQVELFDNQICGSSNVSIYQYAMVLVCCNNGNGMLVSSHCAVYFSYLF